MHVVAAFPNCVPCQSRTFCALARRAPGMCCHDVRDEKTPLPNLSRRPNLFSSLSFSPLLPRSTDPFHIPSLFPAHPSPTSSAQVCMLVSTRNVLVHVKYLSMQEHVRYVALLGSLAPPSSLMAA
eukprot:TRINITY_DN5703_c0_g1_i1.p1 TRINITY_DN5703_c0_g1~~TRINITY_DN5703_c0_g1_i1.p1  ORF type:complete len:125 (-),score=9.56 TRINITY_DN5703_c0_g1_i1:32-406(-)